MQISCAATAQLTSAFVFATQIVQSLFFLNVKFQASNLLLLLYRPVCVGPGQNSKLLVFSCEGSNMTNNRRKQSLELPIRSDTTEFDTTWSVQTQRNPRILKFWFKEMWNCSICEGKTKALIS